MGFGREVFHDNPRAIALLGTVADELGYKLPDLKTGREGADAAKAARASQAANTAQQRLAQAEVEKAQLKRELEGARAEIRALRAQIEFRNQTGVGL